MVVTCKCDIRVDSSCVVTLEKLAERLADTYGWRSYRVDGDEIHFEASADGDPVEGWIDTAGIAHDSKTGEFLDAWDVDFNDVFDVVNNYVWGEDENGNTVMVVMK